MASWNNRYGLKATGATSSATQGHGSLSQNAGPNQQNVQQQQQQPRTKSGEMPSFGATFVPGGFDDYYMPEVIAPSPQRVMPEVPQNMQSGVQRMEAEARGQNNQGATNTGHGRNYSIDDSSSNFKPFQTGGSSAAVMDSPSFSPFPKVKGENIPPSDDEKEEILWQAREAVLHSNNVSMQVIWARDTLIWVETSQDVAAREWKRDGRGRERPATPKIEHQLRVDAVNIIDYLTTQDHPEACFMKGKWLEFGKFGQRENKRESYSYYKKAAENGYGRAEYRMGMLYEHSNDIPNAVKHYNIGAQLGDSAANYRLGMMHLMGQHGFQKDFLQGLDLIQKAAETADEDAPQGAYVYGMLIARELPDVNVSDKILPYDLTTARQYIEKAAYLSFAKAQLKMGQAYELSQLGCDFNPAYSLHYYGLAARQGQPEASLGVSRWFLFGYEKLFAKNEQLAFKYAQDAADAGLATGEFAMGYYHEIGIHVQKDLREARRWYEIAAEHGNKDAQERIDSLSQSKILTKQDHDTTTLTRIKSQYGSQRGKRPDRFTKPNEAMPTLSEGSGPTTPVESAHPPMRKSPRQSPPRKGPTIVESKVDFPDPTYGNGSRPPAFTVNVDGIGGQNKLALRPKSAAPYPEDDRPKPLNLRPKSAAPYPEDDRPPLSPHYNPGIRPSAGSGPVADRPMSAFGIRTEGAATGPPNPQLGAGRGRGGPGPGSAQPSPGAGWEPQVPSAYRQPSPGPSQASHHNSWAPQSPAHPQQPAHGYHGLPSQQRLGAASVGPGVTVPGGAAPVGDPNRNRLTKPNPNPNLNKPLASPPGGNFPGGYSSQPNLAASAQPGRDYGPRQSSRPVSENYDRYGAGPPPAGSRPPSHGGLGPGGPMPQGHGGQGHNRLPSGGSGHSAALRPRPGVDTAGRVSAPPGQNRPASSHGHALSPGPTPSPGPTMTGALGNPARPSSGGPGAGKQSSAHPDGKTMGQGPATFEEMGIPQGKNDSDCVVM
ncbi:hypothetical protein OQA88_8772 [Cercophora sp. LCS_1]